jgi:hypothetical protein
MRWWSDNVFVGKALTNESVGMEPIEDGLWRVWYFDYPVGILDERKGRIEKLEKSNIEEAA